MLFDRDEIKAALAATEPSKQQSLLGTLARAIEERLVPLVQRGQFNEFLVKPQIAFLHIGHTAHDTDFSVDIHFRVLVEMNEFLRKTKNPAEIRKLLVQLRQ